MEAGTLRWRTSTRFSYRGIQGQHIPCVVTTDPCRMSFPDRSRVTYSHKRQLSENGHHGLHEEDDRNGPTCVPSVSLLYCKNN